MATRSSVLAWKIPWTQEPGGLQSMGSQRVRHDWATKQKTRAKLRVREEERPRGPWACERQGWVGTQWVVSSAASKGSRPQRSHLFTWNHPALLAVWCHRLEDGLRQRGSRAFRSGPSIVDVGPLVTHRTVHCGEGCHLWLQRRMGDISTLHAATKMEDSLLPQPGDLVQPNK